MNPPVLPDELAKYAPRSLREGLAKPKDTVALPPATKLAVVHAHSEEPPWRGASPFDGDVRAWRALPPTPPDFATRSELVLPRASGGLMEKLFWTAAVTSVAVSAIGVLGLLILPSTPRQEAEADAARATVASQAVSQRDKEPMARAGTPAGSVVEAVVTTSAPEGTPVADAVATSPQVTDATEVVANADLSALQPPPARQPTEAQDVRQAPVQPLQPLPTRTDAPTSSEASPTTGQSARALGADEIGRLVSRGEAFLAQGDVISARVLLLRAAEAHDPRAALALGSTFDPNVLKSLGVVGIRPDPEQAHAWYERAADFGSGDAAPRLSALAQLSR